MKTIGAKFIKHENIQCKRRGIMTNCSWENTVDINNVVEIRCGTTVFFGVGAIQKIDFIADVLKSKGVDKVVIVTDDVVYNVTGIKDICESILSSKNIHYIVYEGVKPNPNMQMIDEVKKLGAEFGAQAVFGIGGGSHIDTAKSAAVLLHEDNTEYSANDLFEFKFTPENALPIIAINTTHGTGTEVDRFAIATIEEKGFKPAFGHDCIYPMFAICDPATTKTLPLSQTTLTAFDAITHIIEGVTTILASPYGITLSKEPVRLIAKYLPVAQTQPDDLTARYFLMYAATMAGIVIDNSLLHFGHALEHPLSGMNPEITHGLGLAVILPSVIKECYPVKSQILGELLQPIVPGLNGTPDEAQIAADGIKSWIKNIGITQKLRDEPFGDADIEKLTDLVFNTPSLAPLLSIAPIEVTRDTIKKIYKDSLL